MQLEQVESKQKTKGEKSNQKGEKSNQKGELRKGVK